MHIFLIVLHVILCILLVLIILLQPGKGGDVGAAFGGGGGGGGGGMFGPRGPATMLSRATTGVAVTFMVTSILLALPWYEGDSDVESILSEEEEKGGLNLLPDEPVEPGTGAESAGDGAESSGDGAE